MHKTLIQVRPGFEGDAAAELTARAGETGGWAATAPGQVVWTTDTPLEGGVTDFIFARQVYPLLGEVNALPEDDRVGPIVEALQQIKGISAGRWKSVVVECADLDDGQGLKRFMGKFQRPLQAGLERAALIDPQARDRLYVYFIDYERVLLGQGRPGLVAPWTMGIPRFKLPAHSPSRAALKLIEAMKIMVPREAHEHWFAEGMTVVDLGAAPGGWTHVMREQGAFVTAVDNGELAPALMQDEMVQHLAEDAFHYRPRNQVQWLICDVIERPDMVTKMVQHWFQQQWTQQALFTLKLPMKQRYQTVAACMQTLDKVLRTERGPEPILRAKQLYHNRSEVTVLAAHGLGRRALARSSRNASRYPGRGGRR